MLYSIGLQSGATDGAVSWGVLDRLLEDEHIELDGISGASSGSANTMVLGYGLATGGRGRARALLEEFWRTASGVMPSRNPGFPPAEMVFGRGSLAYLPQFWAMAGLIQSTSPYAWNPLGFNPMREAFGSVVDFAVLRAHCPVRLFVSATNVMKGAARIFRNSELSLDVATASTCLPLYLHAQKIGDEYYWDGGLVGAPKLAPLVEECTAEHIIFIRISPVERPQLPATAFEIIERTTELAIAAGVDEELRRIEEMSRLIEEGRLQPGHGARHVRIHRIEGTTLTRDLPFSAKYNMDWQFLCELRDFGRKLADDWLKSAPHVVMPHAPVAGHKLPHPRPAPRPEAAE